MGAGAAGAFFGSAGFGSFGSALGDFSLVDQANGKYEMIDILCPFSPVNIWQMDDSIASAALIINMVDTSLIHFFRYSAALFLASSLLAFQPSFLFSQPLESPCHRLLPPFLLPERGQLQHNPPTLHFPYSCYSRTGGNHPNPR